MNNNNISKKKSSKRSRSRSPRKDRKIKRKPRKRHHSRSSSPHYSSYHSHSSSSKSSYSSNSKSSSSSKSRSKSPFKSHSKSQSSSNKQCKPSEKVSLKPRPRINPFMLSGILLDQKKMNIKLDDEEVNKANKQFKELDRSERKATLLSNYINKTEEMLNKEEYFFDYVNGAYIKVLKPYICDFNKCGQRFRFHHDLNEHLENHLKEDRNKKNLNKKN